MQQARYIEGILLRATVGRKPVDRGYAQTAIEWAILSGLVPLTYRDASHDVAEVMVRYDEILEAYREHINPKLRAVA